MANREMDQDRKNRAYELRIQGRTYREIGTALGIGHGTAERWCKDWMETVSLPLIDEVRKQEVDRLTRYLDRLDSQIDDGDDKAINLAIKISESLRKLLGADAPTVSVVEKKEVTQLDLDIASMITEQKARNALDIQMASEKGKTDEQA